MGGRRLSVSLSTSIYDLPHDRQSLTWYRVDDENEQQSLTQAVASIKTKQKTLVHCEECKENSTAKKSKKNSDRSKKIEVMVTKFGTSRTAGKHATFLFSVYSTLK